MDLKDEVRSLDPYMRRRVRFVTIFCGVWGGVLVLTAASFQICKPWMDKVRLQKEALLTTTNLEDTKDGDLLTT
ncbi:unnamed protein product [Pocillopora meandrina]|uniref:Uncharacterized protein n=1 Tax=Pocillopora meandrina TaxID=46732 RepID=A0AAU9X1H8_9CNID|nr:unnamed protein product [Pocillopora meandrina]